MDLDNFDWTAPNSSFEAKLFHTVSQFWLYYYESTMVYTEMDELCLGVDYLYTRTVIGRME